MNLQSAILKRSASTLPKFNMDFILNYRRDHFINLPLKIEEIYKEAVLLLEPYGLRYTGFTVLSPEERIQFIEQEQRKYALFEVHDNTYYMVRYEFEFNGQVIHTPMHIPYLSNHRVSYGGVDYYPDLPIIEKCVHVNKNSGVVVIKISKALLMFWKSVEWTFRDKRTNRLYKESVVTGRVFLAKKPKKAQNDTLLIYPLADGWDFALWKYGIPNNELTFTYDYDPNDLENTYIEITDSTVLIKANTKSLDDVYRRMFIASVKMILDNYKKPFRVNDLLDRSAILWQLILGDMICTNEDNRDKPELLLTNAKEHMTSNSCLIGNLTKRAFRRIGVEINDFHDFIQQIWLNIHKWSREYEPTNLYDKRISLVMMFSKFESKLSKDVYAILKQIKKNKQGGLLIDNTKKLTVNKATYSPVWFENGGLFQSNPALYNSNVGLRILSHRFLSVDSDEQGGDRKKRTPEDIIKFHISRVLVTTLNDVQASSPLSSGTISGYFAVDQDGHIIVSDALKKIIDDNQF